MKITLQRRRHLARIRTVEHDDVVSPRDGSHRGIVADWSKCGIGDEYPQSSPEVWRADKLATGDVCVMLPVYAYVHSNVRISTTPYNDRWDSGQIGFIYCLWERARFVYNHSINYPDTTLQGWVKEDLEKEIYQYDAYLNGEVFEVYYEVESQWHPGLWVTEYIDGDYYGMDTHRNGMRDCASYWEQYLIDNAVWEA